MYYDYFLTHRALQIQQLCSSQDPPRIELPSRLARTVSSKLVGDLCRTIEDLCRLPLGDEPDREAGGAWSKLRSRLWGARPEAAAEEERAPQPMLAADGRELINQFETELVRIRLSDDASAAEFAAGVMDALWKNRDFFDGLKPLAVHTDHFAYEFLYPTWFNLYTVLSGQAKSDAVLSTEQVKSIFRFLDAYEHGGTSRDPELVGLCTLIANRFPVEEVQTLLQRLIDVCCCPGSDLAVAAAATVRPLRESTRTVGELLPLIKDYLLVESCLRKGAIKTVYHIVPGGLAYPAVPEVLGKAVREGEANVGRDAGYATLLRRIGQVLESVGGFHPDFERLLGRNEDQLSELLSLVGPGDEGHPALPLACQGLVARLLEREQDASGTLDLARMKAFAQHVAPRLDRLDESTQALWDAEFAKPAANRKVLLDSCAEPAKRLQLALHLLKVAQKTAEGTRFFDLLEIAAVLDPKYEDERLARIRLSAQVMRLAIANGFIVHGQLTDLIHDIQAHLPAAVAYLEYPARTAVSKSDRLCRLYLTLNHERDEFTRTGRIGNFARTHAAYSKRAGRSGDKDE
jgi:hypothetical protein